MGWVGDFVARIRESDEQRLVREQRAALLETLGGLPTTTLAGLVLAQDEIGWQRLGGPQPGNNTDFSDVDRVTMVQKSRLYWSRDPLAKHAVRLYTAYALGKGIEARHSAPAGQKVLDEFAKDPLNSKLIGKVGLRKLSNRLLVDGELFLAVVTANKLRPQVRRIEPLEIAELVTDPEDGENVWFYRRDLAGGGKTIFYAAADADFGALQREDAVAAAFGQDKAKAILSRVAPGIEVVHITINTLGQRGYPIITPSLDWTKQLRKFMEDRATITRAASQFAYKKTLKGSATTVGNTAAQMRQPMAPQPTAANYDVMGPISGSTLVQNGAVDTEQFKFDTMAGNAETDARLFRLQFQVGVGIPEHYFADASTGNLATSTSMERPVELTFLEYQEVLVEALAAVYRKVLKARGQGADGLDVITPPLLNTDVPEWIGAVAELLRYVPELDVEAMWRQILATLGIKDIDAAIKQIQAEVERRQKAQAQAEAAKARQIEQAAAANAGAAQDAKQGNAGDQPDEQDDEAA